MTTPPLGILFVAANPRDTVELNLDDEFRAIDDVLQKSEYRNSFELHSAWAASYGDLQEHLLRYKPHIVHFSGHGSTVGEIVLTNDQGGSQLVPPSALADLFAILKDNVRGVVLNACYSERQGAAIARSVDFVVGMSRAIQDDAAINFATGFYLGLGWGRSVETAFALGCNRMGMPGTGAIHRDLQLLSVKGEQGQELLAPLSTAQETPIPQLLCLHNDPAALQLFAPPVVSTGTVPIEATPTSTAAPDTKPTVAPAPVATSRGWGFRPLDVAILLIAALVVLVVLWPRLFPTPPSAPVATSAPSTPSDATPAPSPTPVATPGQPTPSATRREVAVIATVPAIANATTGTEGTGTEGMATITTKAAPDQPLVAEVDSLLFQTQKVLALRSGEFIPFANIRRIDVSEVEGNALPIAITFSDGTTLDAKIERDADFLEGKTAYGPFQTHLQDVQRIEIANQSEATPVTQPIITVTTQDGDMAQLIASSLIFQSTDQLVLATTLTIPFAQIRSIDVDERQGNLVPLHITLTDGRTLASGVIRYSDLLEAHTPHGTYVNNLFMLKRVEFPDVP